MNTIKVTEPMLTGPTCPQCGAQLPAGALAGLCPACLLKQGAAADTATEPASRRFTPPTVAELARFFPHLEIIEFVGQGGMGAVYKARQPALDRVVALKILPPEEAGGAGFSERFTREARALARLNHPNIVAVYDFGVVEKRGDAVSSSRAALAPALSRPPGEGGTVAAGQDKRPLGPLHFFLMEFVDGLNLRQLEQAGKLSPREALQIIPQICDALQYAHDEGVVHRDIKPENVLVDRKGRVKIADFGLAKILGREPSAARLTGEGQVMGTPHYMAPEQIEHPLQVDHRADIYSLGVVFYEMLTGELPLGRFAPPSQRVQVDVRLDEVVLHALEKEPRRRYQHASEVKSDVETIAGGAAAPPTDAVTVRARKEVKAPASWLVATGVLNWIAIPFIALVAWSAGKLNEPTAPMLVSLLAILFLSSAIILAGLKMNRLEAFRLAIVGSVLAILITPGNIIGLPIGIWSLTVLLRRDVREGFAANRPRVAPTPSLGPAPAPGAVATKSPWLRVMEILSDETFTSPLAAKLVNASALGFAGCLGFLGYLPFSGAHRLFGFFGFSGLFGLIGAGFIAERCARRKTSIGPGARSGVSARLLLWAGLAVLGWVVVLLTLAWSWQILVELPQDGLARRAVQLVSLASGWLGPLLIAGGCLVVAALALGLTSTQRTHNTMNMTSNKFVWFGLALGGLCVAAGLLTLLLIRNGGGAPRLADEGWQLWQAGRLTEAAAKFRQAVQLAPNNANAWNGLGWATFNAGKPDEAEPAFQKAVALEPNHAGALNGLGQIHLSQRKYTSAEAYLLKAEPTSSAAWFGLARLYLLEGKFDLAEPRAAKLVDSGQGDELARLMLEAAKAKKLSEALRLRLEPPRSKPTVASPGSN